MSDRDSRCINNARAKSIGLHRSRVFYDNLVGGSQVDLHRDMSWCDSDGYNCDGTKSRLDYITAPPNSYYGYSEYVQPVVNPSDYIYYWVGQWRVAVPKTHAELLIRQIRKYGPQSAGYVRTADTFVPSHLAAEDRMILASKY